MVSSFDAEAMVALREALVAEVRRGTHARRTLFVPYADGALCAEVYRSCAVLRATAGVTGQVLEVEAPVHVLEQLVQRCGEAG